VESHWVLVAQGEKESVAGDSGGIAIGLRVQTQSIAPHAEKRAFIDIDNASPL